MRNQFENAVKLTHVIICRRRKEQEEDEEKVQEQVKLMMEQVKDRRKAARKKVLFEVCCGEYSKLASHFKEKGGEAIRLFLPKHDVSKDWTIEAAKRVIGSLKEEGFEVKLWISVPRSPWRACEE